MKRVALAFGGTLVGGFALFAVANHFRPIADPRKFGEIIGDLAVLFAIAAALDEMRHRANKSRSRSDAGGSVPNGSPEDRVAVRQMPRAKEVGGPGSGMEAGEHPLIFRPCRKPLLTVALLLAGIAAFYAGVLGVHEPIGLFQTLKIPGPLAVGASLAGAVLYLGLFLRSYLPGHEIVVNASGLILPRDRCVTWDQIAEVKLCGTGYTKFFGTVRIRLKGPRPVHFSWLHTNNELRKLYEAIQACFEEHERRAERQATWPTGIAGPLSHTDDLSAGRCGPGRKELA